MLPELAKHLDIHLYIDRGYTPVTPGITAQFSIIPFNRKTFDPGKNDEILYHMGNSFAPHHYIYEALKEFPGIVVLHDYLLQGFYAEKYFAEKDFAAGTLMRMMGYGKPVLVTDLRGVRFPTPGSAAMWDNIFTPAYGFAVGSFQRHCPVYRSG